MAKVLFIKREDVVRASSINGSLDTDKLVQWIYVAQEIHIQNYLGTRLYNKFRTDIAGATLNATYEALLDDYIQPMLIHWALVEYLPHAAYTIANGGAYKHNSENATTMDKEEIDFLVNKHRDIAEHYTRRFIDYMSFNQNTFPEYNQSQNEEMYPDKDARSGGWVL